MMFYLHKYSVLILFIIAILTTSCYAIEEFAPVSGFARSFILGTELSDATITVLETGLKIKTDNHGRFGPFLYPVGKPITLIFEKWGYKTTQSGTQLVPRNGLTGPHNNITFQVPSLETYYLLATIMGVNFDKDSCHVATTIMAYGKTMDDDEQGEPDAKVTLTPNMNETPFYFDIFQAGPLKGKTNPFTKGLIQTTKDGGVAFYNLPPRDEPYTLSAEKNGVAFTQAQFICRKDVFINISPPRGPMALQ
ncbi:MAG: carboxypeptidase regulatory-like domain-containing protein [Gammaproteobacteria bacterium]|nr:carboxypeptidase regulatory-like domain-containing protein [Gammaproteobacteria bacterium]MCW5582838.1 carboxypeptidase regulatory-like domain-containing protein [Gammaproteobacteria bacterium]